MGVDLERVRENVRAASNEDLLDRVTAFRRGMEPEALRIIEKELQLRGVMPEDIARHGEAYRGRLLVDEHGLAVRCWQCQRPAVQRRVVWLRLFWLVPFFPVWRPVCAGHGGEGNHVQS